MLGLKVGLLLQSKLAMTLNTFQRRHAGRENGIQLRPIFFPLELQGGLGQSGLAFEEIIEAPLLDPSLFANLVDGGAVVGTSPKQIADGFHQPSSGVAYPAHKSY